jgi:ethanolamine-phosphate cytidylyltransferase
LTTLEYLDKYNCDFCVHGDDVTTMADGTDCYSVVKEAGRYQECKRTEGVSTTDLVQRMLLRKENNRGQKAICNEKYTRDRIELFESGSNPAPGDKIVYVSGSFDMFHPGHVSFLKAAKVKGDFLIVGIHEDEQIADTFGAYPILNLYERALSVLSCRYVDQVVMDAPITLHTDFLENHKIHLVLNPIESNESFFQVFLVDVGRNEAGQIRIYS